jgi:hypothetical protein
MKGKSRSRREDPEFSPDELLALVQSKGLDPRTVTRRYGVAIPDPNGRFVQRFREGKKRNSSPKNSAYHRVNPENSKRYVCKLTPQASDVRVLAVPPQGRKCGVCFPEVVEGRDKDPRGKEVLQSVGRGKRQR